MRIKKIAASLGVLGKILNNKSTSKQDTYSCDYLNNKFNGNSPMESIAVEDIKSKNLYNPAQATYVNGNVYYEYSIDNTKHYVFQSPYDYTLIYGLNKDGEETRYIYEEGKDKDSRIVKFVPQENEVKIRCGFYTTSSVDFNGVQLEEGDEASPYTSHKDFSIDDTGWIKITQFYNDAGHYNEALSPVRYRRIGKVVYLDGLLKSGTTGLQFKMPEGFIPSGCYRAYVLRNGTSTVRGFVNYETPNGDFVLEDAIAGTEVVLTPISYIADK